MFKWLMILGALAAAPFGAATAQSCATYPNTLTNGTTADANQVMADFNCAALLGAANTWPSIQTFAIGAVSPTPTAGDYSTKVATTAFVHDRGMQSAGQVVLSANTTLGANLAGTNILFGGANLTFPASGGTYAISNIGSTAQTLSFPTGTDFRGVIYPGEQVVLSGDGGGFWRVTAAANLVVIPQNSQSGPYTLALGDAAHQIYHPSSDTTARTWTIPANSATPFAVVTKIDIVNDCSAGALTLAITADTLVWSPTGATGSRTLAACGQATLVKIGATRWMISGTGIT